MRPQVGQIDCIEFPGMDRLTLDQRRDFYGASFGWKFQVWNKDYVDTACSGVRTGFDASPEDAMRQPMVVIYAEDLEKTLMDVEAAGGTISRHIFPFPGGRRFHFFDPAGNELAVWSSA